MWKFTLALLVLIVLESCSRLQEKGKETINGAGQIVGQGASQFVSGVKEGVDKTFQSRVELSDSLKANGLSTGKFEINHERGDTSYILTVYCIFAKNFDHDISVRVYDQKGVEYGRKSIKISGKAGDTHYADIVFDRRTLIESRSTFKLQ